LNQTNTFISIYKQFTIKKTSVSNSNDEVYSPLRLKHGVLENQIQALSRTF